MKREDLDGFTDEQKDLVMKLFGKELNELKSKIEESDSKLAKANAKIEDYESKISEFNESNKSNEDYKLKFEELQNSINEQKAREEAEAKDKQLTDNIMKIIGDKQFTSEYARRGLIGDIKNELAKQDGKGISEILEALTKDSTDIFANPNPIQDMEGMGDNEINTNKKEIPLMW